MHKNNENHRKRFFASLATQYESCVSLLNSYSYVFYDKTLILSQALNCEGANRGNVTEVWRTKITNKEFFPHVKSILKH